MDFDYELNEGVMLNFSLRFSAQKHHKHTTCFKRGVRACVPSLNMRVCFRLCMNWGAFHCYYCATLLFLKMFLVYGRNFEINFFVVFGSVDFDFCLDCGAAPVFQVQEICTGSVGQKVE